MELAIEQQPAPVSSVCASPSISPVEEGELSWYFGPGAAYFERSTFGDQLRMADNRSHESETCWKCDGFGFVELTAEQIVKRSSRIREVLESIADRLRSITDEDERERERQRLAREREKLTRETVCKACEGTKVSAKRLKRGERELTVLPKSSAQWSEPATEPEDWALCRYARVSRRLDGLTDRDVNVLRLYYGDIGSSWAGEREGRLLALYALTAPGKKLARKGLSKDDADALAGLGVRPDQSIVNQANAQRRKIDATRGKLLLEAREAAKRLLDDATREWVMTR